MILINLDKKSILLLVNGDLTLFCEIKIIFSINNDTALLLAIEHEVVVVIPIILQKRTVFKFHSEGRQLDKLIIVIEIDPLSMLDIEELSIFFIFAIRYK